MVTGQVEITQASTKTTTSRLNTRPNQLICSKISKECTKTIQRIQERLMNKDSYKEQFIVPNTNLHITHLVLFETDKSDDMFCDANKKIRKMNQNIEYKLKSLTSYDGNIVLELESPQLRKIQNMFKETCAQYNIKYDKRQNYHITLFKRNFKQGIAPILGTEDIETISNELNKTPYKIKDIDLCHMSKTLGYFPIKSTYTHEHERKGATDEAQNTFNIKLQNKPPTRTPISIDHPQDTDDCKRNKEMTLTSSKPMVRLKLLEAKDRIQDISNIQSNHKPSTNQIDSRNPQPKTKVTINNEKLTNIIHDIDNSKDDKEITTLKENKGGRGKHNYNTRQMDQFHMALVTLFLLTLNTVTGNPNNDMEYLRIKLTPLNESQLIDFTTRETTNQSQEANEAQNVSTHDHYNNKFMQQDTSLYPLLPIMAILMVVIIILIEVLCAIGKTYVERSEMSGRSEEGENIESTNTINQQNHIMNIPMITRKKDNKKKNLKLTVLEDNKLKTQEEKTHTTHKGSTINHKTNKPIQIWKPPIILICLILMTNMTNARLEDNMLKLEGSISNLLTLQGQSRDNIIKIYDNFIQIQIKAREERKKDFDQLSWIPKELSTIKFTLNQVMVVEQETRSMIKGNIIESGLRNMRYIQSCTRAIRESKKTKRDIQNGQKDKLYEDPQNTTTMTPPIAKPTRKNLKNPRLRESKFEKRLRELFRKHDEEYQHNSDILETVDNTSTLNLKEDTSGKIRRVTETKIILKSKRDTREDIIHETMNQNQTLSDYTLVTDNDSEPNSLKNDMMTLLTELQEFNKALNPSRSMTQERQTCEINSAPQNVGKSSTIHTPPMCAIYAVWADTMSEKLDLFDTRVQNLDCQISNNAGSIPDQSQLFIRDTTEEGLQQELLNINKYKGWIQELSKKTRLELLEMNDGLNLLALEITNGHGSIKTLLEESNKVFENTIKLATKKANRKKNRNKRDVGTNSFGNKLNRKYNKGPGSQEESIQEGIQMGGCLKNQVQEHMITLIVINIITKLSRRGGMIISIMYLALLTKGQHAPAICNTEKLKVIEVTDNTNDKPMMTTPDQLREVSTPYTDPDHFPDKPHYYPEEGTTTFIYDIGCNITIDAITVRKKNRSTTRKAIKYFEVFISNSTLGHWEEILSGYTGGYIGYPKMVPHGGIRLLFLEKQYVARYLLFHITEYHDGRENMSQHFSIYQNGDLISAPEIDVQPAQGGKGTADNEIYELYHRLLTANNLTETGKDPNHGDHTTSTFAPSSTTSLPSTITKTTLPDKTSTKPLNIAIEQDLNKQITEVTNSTITINENTTTTADTDITQKADETPYKPHMEEYIMTDTTTQGTNRANTNTTISMPTEDARDINTRRMKVSLGNKVANPSRTNLIGEIQVSDKRSPKTDEITSTSKKTPKYDTTDSTLKTVAQNSDTKTQKTTYEVKNEDNQKYADKVSEGPGIDTIINLLEELQSFKDMLNPKEVEKQTSNDTSQEYEYGHDSDALSPNKLEIKGIKKTLIKLYKKSKNLIMTQHDSSNNIRTILKNLASLQSRLRGMSGWDLTEIRQLPDKLEAVITILHHLINTEIYAQSYIKKGLLENGLKNIRLIHSSFKKVRNNRHKKSTTPWRWHNPRVTTPKNNKIREHGYTEELKQSFQQHYQGHQPDEEFKKFSLEVQKYRSSNLEDLRPIKILMGKSDTSDLLSMKDTWVQRVSELSIEPDTTQPTLMALRTDTRSRQTQNDQMTLLKELQTLNRFLTSVDTSWKVEPGCVTHTPDQEVPEAPSGNLNHQCIPYATQVDIINAGLLDSNKMTWELDCIIKNNIALITNTTRKGEVFFRNITEVKLQTELHDIIRERRQIVSTISDSREKIMQVNKGFDLLMGKLKNRDKIMNRLLEGTDRTIREAIRFEVRKITNKQGQSKRGATPSRASTRQSSDRDKRDVNALNVANNVGILPKSISNGIDALNTVQTAMNVVTNAGKAIINSLEGSGSEDQMNQERENFRQQLLSSFDEENRANNLQTTQANEGSEVTIPCFNNNEGIDPATIVWMRTDKTILFNLKSELKSENLQISTVSCNDKGEYRCGILGSETWDSMNIGDIWNIHKLDVTCSIERKVSTTPNTIFGTEGESTVLQCLTSTSVTIQWTKTSGTNKEEFSKQGTQITLQSLTLDDAGIYACTYEDQGVVTIKHIILQIDRQSVDEVETQSLGFLEAFDCRKEIIKKDSVDLTRVGKCNKDDYMAYEPEKSTEIELLHHRTSEEILIKACQLKVEVSTAYCRPGNYFGLWTPFEFMSPSKGQRNGLDTFVTQVTEDYIISEHTCRKAWKTGLFEINLGRQQVSIGVSLNQPSHTLTNIYLHGSTYGANYNCSPVYGWTGTGPVYRGQDNPFGEKKSHEVVRASLNLKLKKVFSLIDTKKQILYIPSAGKEIDIKSMDQEYTTESPTVGTIIILKGDLPLDECHQHFHLAGGPAKLYNPTNQNDDTVPKLIRFETDIQTDKRVFGLQLIKETDVCGTMCYETQFRGIMVCLRTSQSDFIEQSDKDILNDLGASSIALLQVNIDKSIQNLMLNLCLLHQKHQLSALRDIETHGPSLLSPINNGRGIRLIRRGEQAITLECPRVTAVPRSELNGICCNHFPISIINTDGSISNQYLQSLTRQTTDTCDPVPCSELLPIQMRTISGNSICQFKDHIRICDNPIVLQPKNEMRGNLQLLSASEQRLSTVEGSLPGQIEAWSIISTMKMKSVDAMIGTITQNVVKCANNFCISDPISDEFRRNFARASLPYEIHYFTFSSVLQFLTVTAIILFWYEKATGLLSVMVSLHSCCRDEDKNCRNTSICVMIARCFCMFSKACNPLHPKEIEHEIDYQRMKQRVKKVQQNHEVFIEEQTHLLGDISLNSTTTFTGVEMETFLELRNIVNSLKRDIENLQNTIENKREPKQGRNKKTLKRKVSKRIRKYPVIFATPPNTNKNKNNVRFSIEDTEF